MNTQQNTTVEVMQESDNNLVKYASQTGLEPTATTSLVDVFRPIFEKSRKAIAEAQGVAESVKDATCVKEIRKSRACRLALRAVRLESEAARKKQKESALLYGRAVDGFHNILIADLSPVETALQEAEDIAERAEAARLAQLKMDREKELQPFVDAPILTDLSALTEAQYASMLSDAKLLRQAKLEAAAKAESEAKAKAEADRIERERIAAENARLKAEAEAREAAAKVERERIAAERAAEREAAEAARKLAEETARKEREAVEAKAKAEREKREAEVRAERAAAEVEARKEQERLKAIADEERRKAQAAEAAEKARREAEAKKQAEAAAAAKKAAAAPDNAKLKAFANDLRHHPLPQFSNPKIAPLVAIKIEELAKWIEAFPSNGELL